MTDQSARSVQPPDEAARTVQSPDEAAGKKPSNCGCAICGEKYEWKQPNRLLVVQTGESVNQAKVFRAHAVPQGLCGNLINALKLLANQEDGDGPHTEHRDEPL